MGCRDNEAEPGAVTTAMIVWPRLPRERDKQKGLPCYKYAIPRLVNREDKEITARINIRTVRAAKTY